MAQYRPHLATTASLQMRPNSSFTNRPAIKMQSVTVWAMKGNALRKPWMHMIKIWLQAFLISLTEKGERLASRPGPFYRRHPLRSLARIKIIVNCIQSPVVTLCRVQLKCDGTLWRTGGEVKGNWRLEWIASPLHTTSEHGVSSITTADSHTSAASSRLNWRPCRFKWTRPFRRKTKSGVCMCTITFQTQSTTRIHIHKSYICPQNALVFRMISTSKWVYFPAQNSQIASAVVKKCVHREVRAESLNIIRVKLSPETGVQLLRRLGNGLSLRRPCLYPRSDHIRFCGGQIGTGTDLSPNT